MTTTLDAPVHSSRWRATSGQLQRLLAGLWLFGTGDAFILSATLGNSPWTVLAEGVSLHLPISVGVATQLIGLAVLCGWIPLRERPGLGTVLNVIVIGLAIDAMLWLLPDAAGLPARVAFLLVGVALIGAGSGLYLTANLGPGPRDGWMTGLHRRFGWRLWAVRLGIEASVLLAGAALGGTVGLGTVAFALLIGPAVGTGVRLLGERPSSLDQVGPPTAAR
jgi:uncharacterized membrane protein YczE